MVEGREEGQEGEICALDKSGMIRLHPGLLVFGGGRMSPPFFHPLNRLDLESPDHLPGAGQAGLMRFRSEVLLEGSRGWARPKHACVHVTNVQGRLQAAGPGVSSGCRHTPVLLAAAPPLLPVPSWWAGLLPRSVRGTALLTSPSWTEVLPLVTPLPQEKIPTSALPWHGHPSC